MQEANHVVFISIYLKRAYNSYNIAFVLTNSKYVFKEMINKRSTTFFLTNPYSAGTEK